LGGGSEEGARKKDDGAERSMKWMEGVEEECKGEEGNHGKRGKGENHGKRKKYEKEGTYCSYNVSVFKPK